MHELVRSAALKYLKAIQAEHSIDNNIKYTKLKMQKYLEREASIKKMVKLGKKSKQGVGSDSTSTFPNPLTGFSKK